MFKREQDVKADVSYYTAVSNWVECWTLHHLGLSVHSISNSTSLGNIHI